MHLTIHIGPHKTGTTALQSAFADGARLLRQQGVLYPRCNWHFPAQHRLAFALKARRIPGTQDAPDRQAELTALKNAIAKHKGEQVFISSEEFFSVPGDALEWLRDNLQIKRVSVLTFLRRPDTFLISSYNQKMRQPGNGFDAPLRRFLNDPRKIAPEIDYLRCISNWADAFGDAAIRLETYEAGSPLRRALAHLGLPPDTLPDSPNINRSVPGPVVEALRHAKANGLSKVKQRRLLNLTSETFAGSAPFFVADADRLNIIAAFEADNDRLFKRFGQTNPYTTAGFAPMPHDRDHNLNHGDLMRVIDRLL